MSNKGPKILFLDIETSPLVSYTWGIWDQNVGLNQIKEDWYILSYGAKWAGTDKVIYEDNRNNKNLSNDKPLLKNLWKLLNTTDILVTQNGVKFDSKKINARFVINGMKPPHNYKQVDTLQIAKKKFGFTSNKLEYMADHINKKYKKLKHDKFSGFELWKECLKGNNKAWEEMKKYNIYDVLSLEELYTKLLPWDSSINYSSYYNTNTCSCGSTELQKNGVYYNNVRTYQRYKCNKCGAESRELKSLPKTQTIKGLS